VIADRALARARGLLFRRHASMPDAVMLAPCRAIHTFGMTRPIDAAFTDAAGRVLRVVPAVRPWRVVACRRGHSVFELRAGLLSAFAIRVGSQLAVEVEA
jgi:hypothetical protein